MEILNKSSEEFLEIILKEYKQNPTEDMTLNISYNKIPEKFRFKLQNILNKLKSSEYINNFTIYIYDGVRIVLEDEALTYFEDKKKYEELKNVNNSNSFNGAVINVNGNNNNFGNIINSSIKIRDIEKNILNKIDENSKSAEEKEEFIEIFNEVKEMLIKIEETKRIDNIEKEGALKKITNHINNNSWFYSEMVALVGQFILSIIF